MANLNLKLNLPYVLIKVQSVFQWFWTLGSETYYIIQLATITPGFQLLACYLILRSGMSAHVAGSRLSLHQEHPFYIALHILHTVGGYNYLVTMISGDQICYQIVSRQTIKEWIHVFAVYVFYWSSSLLPGAVSHDDFKINFMDADGLLI